MELALGAKMATQVAPARKADQLTGSWGDGGVTSISLSRDTAALFSLVLVAPDRHLSMRQMHQRP